MVYLSLLRINNSKSTLLCGSKAASQGQEMAESLGVTLVLAPISYLGVLLTDTKIRDKHCKSLVENITNRINAWQSRILSHAGRVEVIKSVLSSFHIYWSRTFLLPAETYSKILKACMRFLWSRNAKKEKCIMLASSYTKVCKSKSHGGLGITDPRKWAKVAVSKLFFKLIADKDSLWAKWAHSHYLKKESIWTVEPKKDNSSIWKTVVQARESMKKHVIYEIGDGSSISLWHDPWILHTPLSQYPEIKMACQHISNEASVSTLIINNTWSQLVYNLPESDIKKAIIETHISIHANSDLVHWELSATGKFSIAETIKKSTNEAKVPWYSLVWNKLVIPKHGFLAWQVFSGAVPTRTVRYP